MGDLISNGLVVILVLAAASWMVALGVWAVKH